MFTLLMTLYLTFFYKSYCVFLIMVYFYLELMLVYHVYHQVGPCVPCNLEEANFQVSFSLSSSGSRQEWPEYSTLVHVWLCLLPYLALCMVASATLLDSVYGCACHFTWLCIWLRLPLYLALCMGAPAILLGCVYVCACHLTWLCVGSKTPAALTWWGCRY